MARPQKEGLEYFSLDVDFFLDRKIKILKAGSVPMASPITCTCFVRFTRDTAITWISMRILITSHPPSWE